MNTLEFFWEVAVMSPHDGGTRMRSGGSGDEGFLPNSFGWEFILFIKTHFYGGAVTSHFMEEHSSPTSIFPVFMMTSSIQKHVPRHWLFLRGIPRWLRGIPRSSVNSPHTDQWRGALMFSLNKRLSKQSRRRWFETTSRSFDVTVMWCRIGIQWSGQPWDLSAINGVTLVHFWMCIMERMA